MGITRKKEKKKVEFVLNNLDKNAKNLNGPHTQKKRRRKKRAN